MSALPQRVKDDFVGGWNDVIDLLGTPFTHVRASDQFSETVVAHMAPTTGDEETMVNELGLEARILRTKSSVTISKNDTMTAPSGKAYTVHAVHEVYVNEVHVGYAVYVR